MKPKKPGRKMEIGRWCYDASRHAMGIFTGYCSNCNAKQFNDRDDITKLVRYVRKDERSWGARVLKHLLATRKV